jgi:hypothetical protein
LLERNSGLHKYVGQLPGSALIAPAAARPAISEIGSAVITREQARSLLLDACPSFLRSDHWRMYEEDWASDPEQPLYLFASALVRHLAELNATGRRGEFPAIFAILERRTRSGRCCPSWHSSVAVAEPTRAVSPRCGEPGWTAEHVTCIWGRFPRRRRGQPGIATVHVFQGQLQRTTWQVGQEVGHVLEARQAYAGTVCGRSGDGNSDRPRRSRRRGRQCKQGN